MSDVSKAWDLDPAVGVSQINASRSYDPDDVMTWSPKEFEEKVLAKLRSYCNKIQTVHYLMRDGKIIIAGEQMQGLSDGVTFLVQLFEKRAADKGTISNANSN